MNDAKRIGIVVIGRNEGPRLLACLATVPRTHTVIYVDSASTDGSASLARGAGIETLELSTDTPLSAARARNAGIKALMRSSPAPEFIQTLDADCTLDSDWLAFGTLVFDADETIAVVAGRLRERHPERSIFNRLCDDEWNAADGEAAECGGVALWRADAIIDAGLFDETLHAGEEPELCHRLRVRGQRVWRTRRLMGTHDANLLAFSSWARRMFRSGFSFAHLVAHAGADGEAHWRREVYRIVGWGLVVPAMAVLGLLTGAQWLVLACLGGWGLLIARMTLRGFTAGQDLAWAAQSSVLNLVGKFYQLGGVVRFWTDRYRGGSRAGYVHQKRS